MAQVSDEAKDIEKLYEFGERLNEAKDKSQHVKDYEGIIRAAKGSIKAKQLAAQLIPRFFKYFPNLHDSAVDAHFDLCEEEELGVRVQAIRGLPLFSKDTPEYLPKIVDVLVQLLPAEENVERDAVHKAIMSLLRQDVKASLTALFKRVGSVDEPNTDEIVREKVLSFIRDKVFPIKAEILKPKEEMERHITNLIKKSLGDVTADEFKMFIDFIRSLSIFGEKAPPERVIELIGIIEEQADLDALFNYISEIVGHYVRPWMISSSRAFMEKLYDAISDTEHIQRLISCLSMAVPIFMRGAPNSKFINYLNKHIIPVFDKLSDDVKLDLLKNLAESSPYTTPQDSREVLPSVVHLLKKYMPLRKTGDELNLTHVECLLYIFHHLAHKAPNAANSLCGYKIVTGQPSDRIGEDFSEISKEFSERLRSIEEIAKSSQKKLTQGMADHHKAISAAKSDEAKDDIITQRKNSTNGLKICNNILAMTQPLHVKAPSFIGDKRINLSWKDVPKPTTSTNNAATGGKRPATVSTDAPSKKGRGSGNLQNKLVNRALEGISQGDVRSSTRGGRSRGRGWGNRGRGRGYW